jgi:hypothetical protein
MEDIKKQRYYIYENINKLKCHNQIIDLINIKGCVYTENDNGIFLNLNTIDDKIITMIYHTVLNNINYKEDVYDNFNSLLLEEENFVYGNNKIIDDKMEVLTYKSFAKNDHEIIDYSKKYNL